MHSIAPVFLSRESYDTFSIFHNFINLISTEFNPDQNVRTNYNRMFNRTTVEEWYSQL